MATENIADFCRIADEQDRSGRSHHGVVLIDPIKYPRGERRTIGRLVTALGRLMDQRPADNAESRRDWL
jgi:hypothetical protein